MTIIETLVARGFIDNSTDRDALSDHLESGVRTFYVGFDPTSTSIHIGNLVPVMAMAWLQRAGHRPIAVLGGGTVMVGDPSGKDQTRELLTPETIARNLKAVSGQMGRFLDFQGADDASKPPSPSDAIMVDNGEWLLSLNYIEFLRDIGRHFSINRMLSAEGTRQRLERDQGMSFIEFNYHLLQSYDFLVLNQGYDCTLQLGGSDQWFNILGGVDLVRRVEGKSVHALTVPLIMTADGKKMGKTEKGAVWLDPEMVSPYDYYQFWVNVNDADVVRFLKLYTFLELDRIEELSQLTGAEIREAKAVLAWEATAIAHGASAADAAQAAAKKVFTGQASEDMPTHSVALPTPAVDAFVGSGLAPSKGAARRLIQQGGARFEGEKITDVEFTIEAPGVLWFGKKRAVRILASND